MLNFTETKYGYDITITHGDTLMFTIDPRIDGEPYEPEEGDVIRFAMTTGTSTTLVKDIPTDTMLLYISKEEMDEIAVGIYDYDIEYTSGKGIRETFIEGKVDIRKEVY